jgi:UPF0288 family protein (methanogenesis marker protein 3)
LILEKNKGGKNNTLETGKNYVDFLKGDDIIVSVEPIALPMKSGLI